MSYKEISVSSKTRNLVCGDIHGYHTALMSELDRLSFSDSDNLFLLGDMVNRGHENLEMIEFLQKDNVYAIAGNHELSILDYYSGTISDSILEGRGGKWFIDLPEEQKEMVVAVLSTLPIAMKVTTSGGSTRGLVHAACPTSTWAELVTALRTPEPRKTKFVRLAVSDRISFNNQMEKTVSDIDWILVGHNPVERVGSLGNTMYLDCGLYLGGSLKVIDLIRMSVV